MTYSYNPLASLGLDKSIPLDGSGKIPSGYLPSYVDDVVEYDDLASFPGTGETGKIYVAKDTGYTYRWTGSVYVRIGSGGEVELNLGSDSSPSLYFTGDTNTGIYSPGADQLALSTNGTQALYINADGDILVADGNRMEIDEIRARDGDGLKLYDDAGNGIFVQDGGNVGIGTSSPGALFHAVNTSAAAATLGAFIQNADSSANTEVRLGFAPNTNPVSDNRYAYIGAINVLGSTDNSLAFGTGSGVPAIERMRIDSLGRVGIGTTSPGVALDVNGDARADGLYGYGDTNTGIEFPGSDVIVFKKGGAEAARIDSSGRLLVGTSSGFDELYPFEVVGSGAQYGRFSTDATGANVVLSKARGSFASPSVVDNGDTLGQIAFKGYSSTATAYRNAAYITAQVDGEPDTGGDASDMPGRLVFSTTADGGSSPTERMRIAANGNVQFNYTGTNLPGNGNTDVGAVFERVGDGATLFISRANNIAGRFSRNSDGDIHDFRRSGSSVGAISVTTSATAYNTSSDYRLKENVTPVTDGITRLQQLKPSRFNFIADPAKTVDGFLAHEVQDIVPEAITGEKDEVDENGDPIYQGIDQSKLVPLLTAALQEAIGEIESLKARVAALESA